MPEWVGNCRVITIDRLRSQLSAALARAEAAELENSAWRALAEWEAEPGVYRALVAEERYESSHSYRFCAEDGKETRYGAGLTPQAAAIDLATKLGLLNPESGAKGEGGGEGTTAKGVVK